MLTRLSCSPAVVYVDFGFNIFNFADIHILRTSSIASSRVLFNMRALNSEDDPNSQTIQLATIRFRSQSNGQNPEITATSSQNEVEIAPGVQS